MQKQDTQVPPRAAGIEAACLHAEAKLRDAGKLLLDIRPEAVERCKGELQQVIVMLEKLVSEGPRPANPRALSALLGIRRSAHALKLQIEFASNLYFGWLQLRLGAGYTQQGLPVLAEGQPGSSFEA